MVIFGILTGIILISAIIYGLYLISKDSLDKENWE